MWDVSQHKISLVGDARYLNVAKYHKISLYFIIYIFKYFQKSNFLLTFLQLGKPINFCLFVSSRVFIPFSLKAIFR